MRWNHWPWSSNFFMKYMYINCTYWFPGKSFWTLWITTCMNSLVYVQWKVTLLIGSSKFQRPRKIVFINLFLSHLLNFYWKFSVLQASMKFFFQQWKITAYWVLWDNVYTIFYTRILDFFVVSLSDTVNQ